MKEFHICIKEIVYTYVKGHNEPAFMIACLMFGKGKVKTKSIYLIIYKILL